MIHQSDATHPVHRAGERQMLVEGPAPMWKASGDRAQGGAAQGQMVVVVRQSPTLELEHQTLAQLQLHAAQQEQGVVGFRTGARQYTQSVSGLRHGLWSQGAS